MKVISVLLYFKPGQVLKVKNIVFPMYFLITRLFSSMAYLPQMHSLGDIGWVRLG